MFVGDIEKFRLRTIPLLPTVYSDALSYIEVLSRVSQKINEVIERVNSFEENILNQANAHTDEKIAELTSSLRAELENFESTITSQQEGFEQNINGVIANINRRIEEFNKTIDANYLAMEAYVNNAISNNNIVIFDKIGEGLLDIRVINIFTGERVTIQEMFDYLAAFHLTNAITLARIEALRRTVDTVISYGTVDGKTCSDLVVNGYTIFGS